MERLDAGRRDDRAPRVLAGAGIAVAGATLAVLGGLGAAGVVFSPPVAFGAAAGFTLAVLLAGAGLSLGSPSRDPRRVTWERSSRSPATVTDGGSRDGNRDRL